MDLIADPSSCVNCFYPLLFFVKCSRREIKFSKLNYRTECRTFLPLARRIYLRTLKRDIVGVAEYGLGTILRQESGTSPTNAGQELPFWYDYREDDLARRLFRIDGMKRKLCERVMVDDAPLPPRSVPRSVNEGLDSLAFDEASTTIQRVFRGWRVRRQFRPSVPMPRGSQNRSSPEPAAPTIVQLVTSLIDSAVNEANHVSSDWTQASHPWLSWAPYW